MITKLTAENNELYQARFELMNQAFEKRRLNRQLTDAGYPQYLSDLTDEEAAESNQILRIYSLEEYFANIKTIQMFVTKDKLNRYNSYPEYTGRCLMMAADEPLFEINANSRIITVPAEFKKNGIAVMGDNYAETVYFKIDKYFDYQSFYDLLQGDDKGKVVINWAFTPTGSKVPAEVHSVEAFGPSDDLEPGYLIFGWIIDKTMTTASGTLTFSVQFYHTTNDIIDYSFNTLTASVPVGNTLVMKNPGEVVNNAEQLGLRLKNSAYRVDAIEGPTKPDWIIDLLSTDNIDDEIGELVLRAEAGIKKGVTIQYRWYCKLTDDDTSEEVAGEDVYGETADTAIVDGKLYYQAVLDDNTIVGYKLLIGTAKEEAFAALGTENEKPIYERYSTLTVTKAGKYSVDACAKVDISNGTWEDLDDADRAQVEAMTRSISSTVCEIPVASEPEVELTVVSNLDPADVQMVPEEENDGHEYIYISATEAPSITAVVSGDHLGKFSVAMLNSESEAAFEALDEDAMAALDDYAAYPENTIDVATSGVNAQGTYKVGVINRLNGTYAKGVSDEIVTSFVAPSMNSIDVTAATGVENEQPIVMLENGEQPDGALVRVDIADINTFMFVDNSDYSAYPNCIKEYWLQEVTSADDMTLKAEDDPAEVALTLPTFMPHDAGFYRIKTVVKYHNTVNEGYTSVFSVYTME